MSLINAWPWNDGRLAGKAKKMKLSSMPAAGGVAADMVTFVVEF